MKRDKEVEESFLHVKDLMYLPTLSQIAPLCVFDKPMEPCKGMISLSVYCHVIWSLFKL